MADRYPLVYNPSANQLQELQSGDSLDAGGTLVKNAVGYSTAGGTSSQFLKADGSTDSNTYLTSAGTIALAQGLTGSPSITVGAVSGTNGTFSGNVSAVNVSASSSVTAATFYGNGAQLTGIDASALKDGSDVKVQATATGATVTGTLVASVTGDVTGNVTGNVTSSGANTLGSLTVSNDATVQGNLTVNGTTTTIDTAVTAVDSLNVDGSVGIGTTNTLTTKLHIQGTGNGSSGSSSLSDSSEASAVLLKPLPASSNAMALGARSSGGHYIQGLYAASSVTSLRDISINPYGGSVGIGTLADNFGGAPGASTVKIATSGILRFSITSAGHILPGADNTQDLGSSSARFANIYTGDLNLSNEGSSNDVDGTWGQYTIQEGEDDLFLINRRTGKKYKFNLTEVD